MRKDTHAYPHLLGDSLVGRSRRVKQCDLANALLQIAAAHASVPCWERNQDFHRSATRSSNSEGMPKPGETNPVGIFRPLQSAAGRAPEPARVCFAHPATRRTSILRSDRESLLTKGFQSVGWSSMGMAGIRRNIDRLRSVCYRCEIQFRICLIGGPNVRESIRIRYDVEGW